LKGKKLPTILRNKDYRFFFFSREAPKQHVHIHCQNGEAKFLGSVEIGPAEIWLKFGR